MRSGTRLSSKGFSLVELLVALFFVSVLMVGMMQIYGSVLSSFASTTESMSANRTKRWAVTQIADDLQSAGYFYFHPNRVLPGFVSVNTTSGQNALMILPNESATYNTFDPATQALVSETVRFDEVQFLQDQPVPVRAVLAEQPDEANIITLTVNDGTLSDVQAGDFVFLLDEGYEICRVLDRDVDAGTVELDTTDAAVQNPTDGSATGASPGLKLLTHQPGTAVVFVRPLQVVRYTVLPLALDPARTDSRIPCLVRDQRVYPTDGARIVWPVWNATTAQLAAAGVTRTIIAENVSGQPTAGTPTLPNQYALRVDISPDNGTTWSRAGATSWPAIATNLNNWLGTAGNGRAPYTSVTNPTNPVWFRNIPALFRVDLTARTSLMRSDPNNPTQRVYTYRSQTLMCQPRNFSLGM